MTRDQLIARLVAIADERPFAPIGHVVEHELPELRAQAEAMPAQEPVAHVCTDDEMRHRDPRWGRVKWINGCDEDECAGMFLYTHCAPDLTARVARLEAALRETQQFGAFRVGSTLAERISAALAEGEK